MLHRLCISIWETCHWPEDWKIQEFVVLFKSGDPKLCSSYRTIALISHTSKILLQIIVDRLKRKLELEQPDEQAAYRKGRGTRDMLVCLQVLIEKVIAMNQQIMFIDYSNAFDSVCQSQFFNAFLEMGFPKHLATLLQSLYVNQRAIIRWNGEHIRVWDWKRCKDVLCHHIFCHLHKERDERCRDIIFWNQCGRQSNFQPKVCWWHGSDRKQQGSLNILPRMSMKLESNWTWNSMSRRQN